MIYLVSSSEWTESLITHYYATNREEIEDIIIDYYQELNMLVRNFVFGKQMKHVYFQSCFDWDDDYDDWTNETFYIRSVRKIND